MSDRMPEVHCCCGMPYTAHREVGGDGSVRFDGFVCPGFRPRPEVQVSARHVHVPPERFGPGPFNPPVEVTSGLCVSDFDAPSQVSAYTRQRLDAVEGLVRRHAAPRNEAAPDTKPGAMRG